MTATVDVRAAGRFDVTPSPQPAGGTPFARTLIAKRFHGELDATGEVEMLSARTAVAGSAAYVALERVEGTLCGRAGSFLLQHSGTMDRGRPALAITVVPDSGTGQLEGLAGSMAIDIAGGEHHYRFTGTLPAAA
ncbi:MAG: DUF3224 domain-containing protein [Burkholderiales bacterium]